MNIQLSCEEGARGSAEECMLLDAADAAARSPIQRTGRLLLERAFVLLVAPSSRTDETCLSLMHRSCELVNPPIYIPTSSSPSDAPIPIGKKGAAHALPETSLAQS